MVWGMAFLMERLRPAAARELTAGIDVPALRGGLLGGAVAAGFGLACVAVPMLLLWIVTPYVVQGPGGVVHLAACVWLLAHGAGLVRPATFGSPGYGGPGVPLAVTPLLVSVLVLVPLYRAGVRLGAAPGLTDGEADGEPVDGESADGAAADEAAAEPSAQEPSQVRSALLGLGLGYLLVAAVAAGVAAAGRGSGTGTGTITVAGPFGAFGWTALVALPVAAFGVRRGAGPGGWGALPRPPRLSWLSPRLSWPPRLPGWLRLPVPLPLPLSLPRPSWLRLPVAGLPDWALAPGGLPVAVRGALGGGAALLGAGGVVLLSSLVVHFGAAGQLAAQTAPDLAGRLALLLLCAAVLPNAVVWSAAYTAGPGFVLGGRLAPLGSGAGVLTAANGPAFPLFTALPGPDRTLLGLLTPALALASGAVVAAIVGKAAAARGAARTAEGAFDDLDDWDDSADPADPADSPGPADGEGWGPAATAGVALAAALGTGLLAALCAAASGGALGLEALARVGPSPWRTGLAALAWSAAVGVPGAVLLRWRLRCRRSAA